MQRGGLQTSWGDKREARASNKIGFFIVHGKWNIDILQASYSSLKGSNKPYVFSKMRLEWQKTGRNENDFASHAEDQVDGHLRDEADGVHAGRHDDDHHNEGDKRDSSRAVEDIGVV